jgi:hypothetical protein
VVIYREQFAYSLPGEAILGSGLEGAVQAFEFGVAIGDAGGGPKPGEGTVRIQHRGAGEVFEGLPPVAAASDVYAPDQGIVANIHRSRLLQRASGSLPEEHVASRPPGLGLDRLCRTTRVLVPSGSQLLSIGVIEGTDRH